MESKSFKHAIKLLSIKDYSEYSLTRKLIDKNFDREEIKETISKLHELNYIREQEFAEGRIRGLMRKGYSKSYILEKLTLERVVINKSLVDQVFNIENFSEENQIIDLIEKKLRYRDDAEIDWHKKQKLLRYLCSKGHNMTLAIDKLEMFLAKNQ